MFKVINHVFYQVQSVTDGTLPNCCVSLLVIVILLPRNLTCTSIQYLVISCRTLKTEYCGVNVLSTNYVPFE